MQFFWEKMCDATSITVRLPPLIRRGSWILAFRDPCCSIMVTGTKTTIAFRATLSLFSVYMSKIKVAFLEACPFSANQSSLKAFKIILIA